MSTNLVQPGFRSRKEPLTTNLRPMTSLTPPSNLPFPTLVLRSFGVGPEHVFLGVFPRDVSSSPFRPYISYVFSNLYRITLTYYLTRFRVIFNQIFLGGLSFVFVFRLLFSFHLLRSNLIFTVLLYFRHNSTRFSTTTRRITGYPSPFFLVDTLGTTKSSFSFG